MQSETALTAAGTVGHADRRWLFEGLGLTIVIVVLAVIFALINPRFASVANFSNILTQASFIIIMAVGMTFVITSAGIDLSVGSLVALVTVIGFDLIKGGMHPALGVLVMFALGGFIGSVTGFLIAFVKIPPFIATLGMMAGLRGFALVHSAGTMHFGLPPSLTWFGQGSIAGVPVPVIISLLFAVFGAWLFKHTKFGLHVRAVGGNREAARLAGVPVNRVEVMVYALMGVVTALGGLILDAFGEAVGVRVQRRDVNLAATQHRYDARVDMGVAEDVVDPRFLDLSRQHIISDGRAGHADENDTSAGADMIEDLGGGFVVAGGFEDNVNTPAVGFAIDDFRQVFAL